MQKATCTECVLNDYVNVLMYTCIDALAFEKKLIRIYPW